MIIIGLAGLKRSGKDTSADILTNIFELQGHTVHRTAFARKLKVLGAKCLGYDGPDDQLVKIMDNLKEEGNIWIGFDDLEDKISGREFLQHLGNNVRELLGKDTWIDQVLPRSRSVYDLEDVYPNVDVLLITDVRYSNEAIRILEYAGHVIRVNRPGVESDGHASEQHIPNAFVTWEVMNDGSLVKLEDELLDAVENLGMAWPKSR